MKKPVSLLLALTLLPLAVLPAAGIQTAETAVLTVTDHLDGAADVADAVLWLASGKASFITGQIIGVDGGFM